MEKILLFIAVMLAVHGVTAFIITLLEKWRIIEWMAINAPNKWINQLANCRFCLSFWINVIICCILAIILKNGYILVIPFAITIKTRNSI